MEDLRELGFRHSPCSWLGLCVTESVVSVSRIHFDGTYDLTVEGNTAKLSALEQ
jgi:hypothetical protein